MTAWEWVFWLTYPAQVVVAAVVSYWLGRFAMSLVLG